MNREDFSSSAIHIKLSNSLHDTFMLLKPHIYTHQHVIKACENLWNESFATPISYLQHRVRFIKVDFTIYGLYFSQLPVSIYFTSSVTNS